MLWATSRVPCLHVIPGSDSVVLLTEFSVRGSHIPDSPKHSLNFDSSLGLCARAPARSMERNVMKVIGYRYIAMKSRLRRQGRIGIYIESS